MLADPVRFDRFELQARERRLLVAGAPAALGARAFDVLLALVNRAGELVTKHELLDSVWAGLVVEEANLTVQVSSLRKVLGGELIATVPGRGYRFTGRLAGDEGAPPAPAAPTATAPAPAPALVGRDEDLARLSRALDTPGCVTLTGPAGVGKTSLARAAAAGHAGGALWVDLAPLTEGTQVPAALARALDIPPPEADAPAAFVRALGTRLLVLDNAEHLIDAAATLAAALQQQAPQLHLAATSQMPLAVPRERVLRLDPLAMPLDSDTLDLHHGAVALFVERATAADHRFSAGAASLPLLREICRQLDGMPLALEMAAARLPTLGLQGLRDALHSRFALLTKGHRSAAARHRTLHAALDWSHGLLSAEERRLFRALGVFAGGFTLELAVAVVAGPQGDRWAVVDGLSTLVDRSLVATDGQDPPRYHLLETMRAYALEQLAAAGEEQALRRRHAQGLLQLLGMAEGADSSDSQRAVGGAEHDNAREALAWALQHDPALAVALAPRVTAVASFLSWRSEALRWLEDSAALVDHPDVGAEARAAWWTERARQLMISRRPGAREAAWRARELQLALGQAHARGLFMADTNIVRASIEPSAELDLLCQEMQQLHDQHPEWQPRASAVLAGTLAHACSLRRDQEGQLQHRLQEVDMARRAGLTGARDAAESNVVATLLNLGRPEEALPRCLGLLQRIGHQDNINAAYAWSFQLSALVSLRRADEARATLPRVMALARRFAMPHVLEELSPLLAHEQRPQTAARLIGHLLRRHEDCGTELTQASTGQVLELEQPARRALGDARFEALHEEGRQADDATVLQWLQGTEPEV